MTKRLSALLLTLFAASANATPLNFSFDIALQSFSAGEIPVRFEMTLDSETPQDPLYSSNPHVGLYSGLMTISIGSQSATTPGSLVVENDLENADNFFLISGSYAGSGLSLPGLPGLSILYALLAIEDSSMFMLSSDALPSPEQLTDYEAFGALALGFAPPGYTPSHGVTISAQINAIPEPSSLALLVLGLAGWWRLRLRKLSGQTVG